MKVPLVGKVARPTPWIAGLVIATTIAIGAGGYGVWQARKPKIDITELTVSAEVKDLTVRISASGTVTPVQTVNLSPKTSGRLAELYV
jgi:HlyD family secretion protein